MLPAECWEGLDEGLTPEQKAFIDGGVCESLMYVDPEFRAAMDRYRALPGPRVVLMFSTPT